MLVAKEAAASGRLLPAFRKDKENNWFNRPEKRVLFKGMHNEETECDPCEYKQIKGR